MRHVIRQRRWMDDDAGMSLVEIMIAVFVLGVGLLALASTAITSIVNLRVSRGRQEATDAASALIEDLRRSDFSVVALDGDDPTTADYLSNEGGCDPVFDEPLVSTDLPGALPHEQTFGPSGRVTLRTHISWFDDGDDHSCSAADHDKQVKRVRVVAEWTDGDRSFTLEESTLVAAVDRGLPAPDFRLGTPERTITMTQDDLGTEQCYGHVLSNVGANDGYDFTVERTDSGSVIKSATSKGEFTTANGDVRIRAFFENPATEPPTDPAVHDVDSQANRYMGLPVDGALELLIDANGNDRPETDPALEEKLPTGEQGRLWFCYEPNEGLGESVVAQLQFTVHSQLDENRSETVDHTFEVAPGDRVFHLYDDDESDEGSSSPRAADGISVPVLPMGPQTSLQPRRLGTADNLPNYDTDVDTYPGTSLPPGTSHESVTFHQQITKDVTFDDDVDLDLYSASEPALSSTFEDRFLRYRVRLQVLESDESTVASTPLNEEFWDDHPTDGWRPMSRSFDLDGDSFTVAADQFLRLEVTCLEVYDPEEEQTVTDESCHLAYDHTSYPASMTLVVP